MYEGTHCCKDLTRRREKNGFRIGKVSCRRSGSRQCHRQLLLSRHPCLHCYSSFSFLLFLLYLDRYSRFSVHRCRARVLACRLYCWSFPCFLFDYTFRLPIHYQLCIDSTSDSISKISHGFSLGFSFFSPFSFSIGALASPFPPCRLAFATVVSSCSRAFFQNSRRRQCFCRVEWTADLLHTFIFVHPPLCFQIRDQSFWQIFSFARLYCFLTLHHENTQQFFDFTFRSTFHMPGVNRSFTSGNLVVTTIHSSAVIPFAFFLVLVRSDTAFPAMNHCFVTRSACVVLSSTPRLGALSC